MDLEKNRQKILRGRKSHSTKELQEVERVYIDSVYIYLYKAYDQRLDPWEAGITYIWLGVQVWGLPQSRGYSLLGTDTLRLLFSERASRWVFDSKEPRYQLHPPWLEHPAEEKKKKMFYSKPLHVDTWTQDVSYSFKTYVFQPFNDWNVRVCPDLALHIHIWSFKDFFWFDVRAVRYLQYRWICHRSERGFAQDPRQQIWVKNAFVTE